MFIRDFYVDEDVALYVISEADVVDRIMEAEMVICGRKAMWPSS